MPRGRGGGGRKLSQIRAEDNDEDTEDPSRGSAGAKDTKPAAASAAQAAADAAAIVQVAARSLSSCTPAIQHVLPFAQQRHLLLLSSRSRQCHSSYKWQECSCLALCTVTQDDGTKIAEQPLSELERDQVRRYRELQRFLRGSPFYVRPPRQSEHAGMHNPGPCLHVSVDTTPRRPLARNCGSYRPRTCNVSHRRSRALLRPVPQHRRICWSKTG